MSLKLSKLNGMFAITVASSLLATSSGCSSNTGKSPAALAPSPVQISGSPRAISDTAQMNSAASANNPRDLATALPEAVLSSLPRDVDLNGNGNGGDASSGTALTYQTLGDMLQKMGVKVEAKDNCYTMNVKFTTPDQIEWSIPFNFSLSTDGSVIWVLCGTSKVDPATPPTVQSMYDLLAINDKLGTIFFSINDIHILTLQQPIANSGLTASSLNARLKAFFDILKKTEPLWKAAASGAGNTDNSGGGSNPFQ
jgi:hypothetical protein